MSGQLQAGAAVVEISPIDSQFLFGYPHVERMSKGVHDHLLSSALALDDGRTRLILIGNDVIFVNKASTARVRQRISETCGVAASNILISATHTHSGPVTADYVSNEADPIVPKADPAYVQHMENGIVEAAVSAVGALRPAEIGLAVGDITGVGTNRRDPSGPSDMQMPVLSVRNAKTHQPIACMLVCCMHPTVLHEDSHLVSGDMFGLARLSLQKHVLGDCPVVVHMGASGNQSPRHVTQANTFAEAERLGNIIASAAAKALVRISYRSDVTLAALTSSIDLPKRSFVSVDEAQKQLTASIERLEQLRRSGAPKTQVRTAECDWFGAEERLTLSKAAIDGRLDAAYAVVLPAEIQAVRVGDWRFVGVPGEMFIEFSQAIRRACPNTFVITCANGELQGYIVTEQALAEGGYEAGNALFPPAAGEAIVATAVDLCKRV